MRLSNFLTAPLGLLGVASSATAFTNPLRNPGGADPQIVWSGGYYYLISTEWTNLQLARAQTIEGLKTAVPRVIYSDANPNRCCSVWAPELHYFDGKWYLYYTAGRNEDLDLQRMHVLVGMSATALQSEMPKTDVVLKVVLLHGTTGRTAHNSLRTGASTEQFSVLMSLATTLSTRA